MADKINKLFKHSIIFVIGIILTLGAVIFADFDYDKKIYYFQYILLIFIALIICYGLCLWYTIPDFIEKIKRKMRVKRAIKDLKKGKEYTHLTVNDIKYVSKNYKEFENIKDINILIKHIQKELKKFSKITAGSFYRSFRELVR